MYAFFVSTVETNSALVSKYVLGEVCTAQCTDFHSLIPLVLVAYYSILKELSQYRIIKVTIKLKIFYSFCRGAGYRCATFCFF